jgi:glycosyltransferase involved in cell wall biosynthesis
MHADIDHPRVLHAIENFGFVSETFLFDRVVHLDRLGWQAWVTSVHARNRDVFDFPPDERLVVTPRRTFARRVLARARRGGRRPPPLPWPLDAAIARARPDVLHAHFGWVARTVLPAARRHGVPLVAGFHGYDVTVWPRYGLPAGENPPGDDPYADLFADAAAILATSHFLARRLRAIGCEREVVVVPSGTDLDVFRYRGPRPIDGRRRLLFVGRLVAYKALDVLLRALPAVVGRIDGVTLDVIGEGPERGPCERLAARLGLGRHVRFHGARSRPDVVRALEASDVLVLPSRTSQLGQAEALGNVLKEAQAIGLAVVATDHGGIPETIPPRFRHELVPENDDAALAARLVAVLGGGEDAAARAREARAWIEREFAWEHIAPQLAAVYERVGRGSDREVSVCT